VYVVFWVSVALTATASSSLDNSGYHIAIFDTNGNQVSASCETGSVCSTTVTSTSAGSKSYIAYVVQNSSGSKANNSNTIAVTWSNPTITLSTSTTNPVYAGGFTLTAYASNPVDNSGYFIQLIDLTHGVSEVGRCTTGSNCAVNLSCPAGAASIMYEAYIDQGNPWAWVATSSALTVYCPGLPTGISLTANGVTGGTVNLYYNDPVTLVASANASVTNTGYEIDSWDTFDNVPVGGGQCSTGSTCQVVQPGPSFTVCITYQAYIDQGGNPASAIATSYPTPTVKVCWGPPVYRPNTGVTATTSYRAEGWIDLPRPVS
jgi:hypothetical protein